MCFEMFLVGVCDDLKCFEMFRFFLLLCFEVLLVVCFHMYAFDSVIFEEFHPVWALYNIKEQAGHMSETPSQASCAGQAVPVSEHPRLYRVPVCQTGAGGRKDIS